MGANSFSALRRQRRSIVSVEEYEVDKAALERMLKDFEGDYLRTHQVHFIGSFQGLPC